MVQPHPAVVSAGPLAGIQLLRSCKSRRVSSWDRTGGNRDWVPLPAHETIVLADIPGAGRIVHIWLTVGAWTNPLTYLRTLVLRAWWDGEDHPSIEVPLGDFFSIGHARAGSFHTLPFNMSAGPGSQLAAMNCYLPMPYGNGARLTLENQDEVDINAVYYAVDYEIHDRIGSEEGRLHAQWRRQNPCDGNPDGRQEDLPNLSDQGNYVILEAEGHGHYIGCNLSVHNLHGEWWGEGDDMFVIDGEPWPPALHGTGSEDYFCHAWGMQDNCSLYNGVSFHEPGGQRSLGERITAFRFHLQDPVVFHRSLRVSIEHGHANQRSDDLSSTAYWYQREPHRPFPALPPARDRLPRRLVPGATLVPVAAPCQRYLVIGPFDNPSVHGERQGLDTIYPPEVGFDLNAEYPGKQGRVCRWEAVSANPQGILNFLDVFGLIDGAVAYALTIVYSPRARKVRLLLGSDDGIKVWLNGTVVHRNLVQRGCRSDEDQILIDLREGENVLLCKVEQAIGAWEMTMRVAELDSDLAYGLPGNPV